MISHRPPSNRLAWIERMTQLNEARRQGRCAFHEGENVRHNPYTDPELAKAWRDSWVRAWQRSPIA